MRIAVVGAGIVGLSVTAQLRGLGEDVHCYEGGQPFGGRSAGDTRIFRLAHGRPELVEAAQASAAGWRSWSAEVGVALLGSQGVLVTGRKALAWAEPMQQAGVPATLHDTLPAGILLPGAPTATAAVGLNRGPFLFDSGGGVLDLRATRRLLLDAAGHALRPQAVCALECTASSVRVVTAAGAHTYDAVVVAAGAGTAALAAQAGVDVPAERRRHSRFTLRLAGPASPLACWLESSGSWREGFTSYGHCVAPGLWAVGADVGSENDSWDLGADEVRRRSWQALEPYLADLAPGAFGEVVDVLDCDWTPIPGGDGFDVRRHGAVTVVWGTNLAKFAPYLGARIARYVSERTGDDGLHLIAPT